MFQMQLKKKLRENIASLSCIMMTFILLPIQEENFSDEMLHVDLFQNFQTPLFSIAYVLTYTHLYIYTHTSNYFSYRHNFFLLNFCTIWRHWLVSTVMSCLKALLSGENKKNPYNSEFHNPSIDLTVCCLALTRLITGTPRRAGLQSNFRLL